MNNQQRILVIEDDSNIVELLEIHLSDMGYLVSKAIDGQQGLELFGKEKPDLVILDIMLPGIDGLDVCKQIRAMDRRTPVLMLTSRAEELDKVLGLELGADDYMTKPFSIRELLARVKAIFRRIEADLETAGSTGSTDILQFQDLQINLEKRKVVLAGKNVDLTAKEFDLLVLFASHPGRPFSRQQLLDMIWGYQFDGYEHTVNSHINRLRSKIDSRSEENRFIKTVWGVGYSFAEKEEFE
jgi:DNA-binding response OmpR family regulator